MMNIQQPPPTSLSPFYLFTMLRVLLGIGLMHDATQANTIFQMQRTLAKQAQSYATYPQLHTSVLICQDGSVPYVQANQELPAFPELPSPPITPTPTPTYEWLAVQLRWICASLVYMAVVISIISKRLSGVLLEKNGQETADAYNTSQEWIQCVESLVVVLSFVVYISEKAYELYTQYFLPSQNSTSSNVFTAEVVLVLILGVMGIASPLLQYMKFRSLSEKKETIGTSML